MGTATGSWIYRKMRGKHLTILVMSIVMAFIVFKEEFLPRLQAFFYGPVLERVFHSLGFRSSIIAGSLCVSHGM